MLGPARHHDLGQRSWGCDALQERFQVLGSALVADAQRQLVKAIEKQHHPTQRKHGQQGFHDAARGAAAAFAAVVWIVGYAFF